MNAIIKHLIFLSMSIGLFSCSGEYKIYISPNGSDNASGNLNEPIATLHHAAKLTRENVGKIPVTIYLSGGLYQLTEPLELNFKDGGAENAPIKWQAMPGEKPIISGGIFIKNWKAEDDGSWSASLPPGYTGKFRSFYVNDKRAIRSRFPNNEYLRIDKAGQDNRTNFFFKGGGIQKIESSKNLELVFLHDWSITRIGIKSIDWKGNHIIAVDSIGSRLPFFTLTNWEEHPRFYLENAKEFCDKPGEWYCDFNNRKIFYHPLDGEKLEETIGVIPIAEKLLEIKGSKGNKVSFISFEGITFQHTSWLIPETGYCGIQACMYNDRGSKAKEWNKVPAAIHVDLAENIRFKNCTIKHTGGSGIWIRENCTSCEISESHIYDISGNGINIGEGQDRKEDGVPWWKSVPEQVSKENKVVSSIIEDCGKQFYGAVGIWAGLVAGTTIEDNTIRNLPYTGISIGWMWDTTATPCRENKIKANHIYKIMNTLSDGGGIYSLGQQPGSLIIDNLIHDVTVNEGRAESNGMFLDEGTQELLVENNIIFNIARSPLRFHKAFNNIVSNNVLVCGDDIPPIRYNRTKEEDIIKVDNILLRQSNKSDVEKLNKLFDQRIIELNNR